MQHQVWGHSIISGRAIEGKIGFVGNENNGV